MFLFLLISIELSLLLVTALVGCKKAKPRTAASSRKNSNAAVGKPAAASTGGVIAVSGGSGAAPAKTPASSNPPASNRAAVAGPTIKSSDKGSDCAGDQTLDDGKYEELTMGKR
ncbi:unnamed protein product [Caenorhabditis auriculariae]|uniref:Uncharacterized protein n=1 Tax=Caenorhabditis auriculariae TaxID=2777116 RepID=A0A8S1HWS4_9PELO|nr:unnamed protein product [Caenorhabditis auriculariae]